MPEHIRFHQSLAADPACPTMRLRGFTDGEELSVRGLPAFLLSTARHFTVASTWFQNPSFPLAVTPLFRRANPRVDEEKMLRLSESRKLKIAHLSTFWQLASGQGWISQPLVVKSKNCAVAKVYCAAQATASAAH
jgi:hypothetical protein